MSPTELASAGAHPWIVNVAFLAVALIGIWATWKRTVSQIPDPKPRAEIAIGDAAILDGKPVREGAAALAKSADLMAEHVAVIRSIATTMDAMLDIMRRRQEAEEIDEREEMTRRLIYLEERLAQAGLAVPPHGPRKNRPHRPVR